jgi:hypothetical protein
VACSPDGWRLATASADGTVKVWDARTDHASATLEDTMSASSALAFSPDGRLMAEAGGNRLIRIWDTATAQWFLTLRGHSRPVEAVAFHPDGSRIASADMDGLVILWDVHTGNEIRRLQGNPGTVWAVAFSPDGRWVASAGEDQAVRLWEVDSGAGRVIGSHEGTARRLAFSPDGRRLISAGGDARRDGFVMVWDTSSGAVTFEAQEPGVYVTGLSVAPDGRVAWGGREGTIRIWDPKTGKQPVSFRAHSLGIQDVAFSPDGRCLASAGSDAALKLWDAATLDEFLSLPAREPLRRLAFRGDGRSLAGVWNGTYSGMTVWESEAPSPDVFTRREALALVRFLTSRRLSPEEVFSRIQTDPTIVDPVRQDALEIAGTFARHRLRREGERLVKAATAKHLLKQDVLEEIRTAKGVGEEVRREALEAAASYVEEPTALASKSRLTVRPPGQPEAAYRIALRHAAAACEHVPDKAAYWTTLGIAHYRVGEYPQAVETLTEAGRLHAGAGEGPTPADLAFLSLALHRAGREQEARAAFARLQALMNESRWARDEEAGEFLREAEEAFLRGTGPPR